MGILKLEITNEKDLQLILSLANRLGIEYSSDDEIKSIKKRKFGCMKGLVSYISDDFDAPLDDFKGYMY